MKRETVDGACCETGQDGPASGVSAEAVRGDVEVLSALGNDTRYELVRRVAAADGDVCVCDLEGAVGVSQSAVSQGLSRLYSAGLLTRRKEGSWRYYDTTETAEALLATLADVRETDE